MDLNDILELGGVLAKFFEYGVLTILLIGSIYLNVRLWRGQTELYEKRISDAEQYAEFAAEVTQRLDNFTEAVRMLGRDS